MAVPSDTAVLRVAVTTALGAQPLENALVTVSTVPDEDGSRQLLYSVRTDSGGMTPPMGTLMFVVCNETGCKLKEFIKESVPFFIVLIAELLMLTFIPVLTTGLVDLMY